METYIIQLATGKKESYRPRHEKLYNDTLENVIRLFKEIVIPPGWKKRLCKYDPLTHKITPIMHNR